MFRNLAKHGRRIYGDDFADPWSSAPRFKRFVQEVFRDPDLWLGPWPEAPPRTWLLSTGWFTKHGPIDLREILR